MQYKIRLLEKENRKLQKEKINTDSRVRLLTMQVIRGKGAEAEKIRSIVQKKNKVSSEQLKKQKSK